MRVKDSRLTRNDRGCKTVGSLVRYLQKFSERTPVLVVHGEEGEMPCNGEYYTPPMFNVIWSMKRDWGSAPSDYSDFVFDPTSEGKTVVIL